MRSAQLFWMLQLAVHTALGPGLLESAYQACLAYELNSEGSKGSRHKFHLPVNYRDV